MKIDRENALIFNLDRIWNCILRFAFMPKTEDKNSEIAEIDVTIINPLKYGLGFIFNKRLIKLLFI